MPASLRTHLSRTTSTRPYDRRSPTASPGNPLVHSYFSPGFPPTQDIDADETPDADQEVDVPPDHPGLPTYADYKRLEAGYLHSLSPRKRDKALITQAMFDKIWDVLHQPEACTVDTPQFRFWVRKMFTLSRPVCDGGASAWASGWSDTGGTATASTSDAHVNDADLDLERSMGISTTEDAFSFSAVVLHENRPVAIMEQLYELFCYCHVRAGHGGRDKTCAVIREHYSWVPKELTAQFVKACPTCTVKRSGQAHGGVGVGVNVGVLGHKRVVVGRGRKKGRAATLEGDTPVQVEPLGVGWPTTGGPLDPANPEPCGVREREQEWLHAREDARTVGPPSPASPALGTRSWSVQREVPLESCRSSEWSNISRALALDASPFHLCDTVRPLGHPLAVPNDSPRRCDQGSPSKTGLPSLASALSNESLDENVNLAGLGPGDAAECLLPPALRPLRLSGPVPSDTESDARSAYPLQIDPALLSFNYPGLGLSSESGHLSDSHGGGDTAYLGPSTGTGMPVPSESEDGVRHGRTNVLDHGRGFYRLRALSDADDGSPSVYSMRAVPALDPSRASDSPDSSFERTALYTTTNATLPLSLSTASMRNRCGSRHGYRDGPLDMLYHGSADEVGRELDGPFPFSIMADA